MLRPRYLYTLLFLALGCGQTDRSASRSSSLVPEPDIRERLHYQKMVLLKGEYQSITLVRLPDTSVIVLVRDSVWPETATYSYTLRKDSTGRLVSLSEGPCNESSGCFHSLTYYFDRDERTFAIDKRTIRPGNLYPSGPAFETISYYYDDQFGLADSEYKMEGKKGNSMNPDGCSLYSGKDALQPSVAEYVRVNPFIAEFLPAQRGTRP